MIVLNTFHIRFKSVKDFPYPCDYIYCYENGGEYEPYYIPEEYIKRVSREKEGVKE